MNSKTIKVYLVGGAVRDIVIGHPSKDLDFVVVGATPEFMHSNSFTEVGADFPVYLHPITNDEFALARTERKTGAGYHGFETIFDDSVTLEDDLARRDLAMNAMAIEVDAEVLITGDMKIIGDIIDPYNGQEDIKLKTIRHTSPAFAEDPLRVLRVARFAARYNFAVAHETYQEMCEIVHSGEMDTLPMERVFAEFKKAMMEDHYGVFFDVLNKVDVVDLYFEELCDWDNAGNDFAVQIDATFEERVCLLIMGFKPREAEEMLMRIKAPSKLIDMAIWTTRLEELLWEVTYDFNGTPTNVHVFEALDKIHVWKNVHKLQEIVRLFLFYQDNGGTRSIIEKIFTIIRAGATIGFDDLGKHDRETLKGKEIGDAITKKRLEVIEELNLFSS